MILKKGCTAWNKGIKRWWVSSTEFKKGNPGYWLGKKRSEETKRKIAETKKGTPSPMKGKHYNLISLCKSCHMQTNYKREDWQKYYQLKLK